MWLITVTEDSDKKQERESLLTNFNSDTFIFFCQLAHDSSNSGLDPSWCGTSWHGAIMGWLTSSSLRAHDVHSVHIALYAQWTPWTQNVHTRHIWHNTASACIVCIECAQYALDIKKVHSLHLILGMCAQDKMCTYLIFVHTCAIILSKYQDYLSAGSERGQACCNHTIHGQVRGSLVRDPAAFRATHFWHSPPTLALFCRPSRRQEGGGPPVQPTPTTFVILSAGRHGIPTGC